MYNPTFHDLWTSEESPSTPRALEGGQMGTGFSSDLDVRNALNIEAFFLSVATQEVLCVFAYEDNTGRLRYRIGMSARTFVGYNKLAKGQVDTTDLTGAQPWAVAYWWDGALVLRGKGANERLSDKLRKRFHILVNQGEREGEL